jgi:hypothetical protein
MEETHPSDKKSPENGGKTTPPPQSVVDFTSNKPYRHSRDNGECPKDYYKY